MLDHETANMRYRIQAIAYLKGGNIYIHVDRFAEYMEAVYITSKESKMKQLIEPTETMTIEIPLSINRELVQLDREDIKPEKLSITLARQMYPWFDELFSLLTAEAHENCRRATNALFNEALKTIEIE